MFNEKLKFLINDRNLTVSKFARELNVAKSCVSGWLNGKVMPKFYTAMLISKYFDCSLNFLFGAAEFEEEAKSLKSINFGKQLKKLLKEKNIKQEKFFKDLNLSSSNISYWSKDNIFPQMEVIVKIANYLNLSVDYLIGLE